MNRQDLFDQTVRKLERVADGEFDELAMLEAAAAVRKLLLDESPLLHQVNRQRRRRIVFEVAGPSALQAEILKDKPTVYFLMEGFSPRLRLTGGTGVEPLKLDPFLARPVGWVQGRAVTVKDIVLQLAHVEGGVHAGTPKTDLEARLHEANAALFIGGLGSVARTMRGIADVVVATLKPLMLGTSGA